MKMKCKKNRHIKWLPHVLTAVLLFILAVFYCGYQKVYTIEKFSITGNYELTDSDVTAISGIKLGEKIFKCNLDAAMSRLNSHPYIRYIYISRQFPNTIKIEIKERRPLALLMTDDAYAIDKYSVILPVPEKNKITKPVIFAYDMNCNAIPGQII